MKRTYALVINEGIDYFIESTVRKVFSHYGGRVPLAKFHEDMRRSLSANLVAIVRLEKTPLENVESKFHATAYPVIGGLVCLMHPKKSSQH